jgi:hypothetical protein
MRLIGLAVLSVNYPSAQALLAVHPQQTASTPSGPATSLNRKDFRGDLLSTLAEAFALHA